MKENTEHPFEDWFPSSDNFARLNQDYALVSDDLDELMGKSEEGCEADVGLYHLKIIHREGGYEGAGSDHYIVIECSCNHAITQLWKIPGWYQSYQGAELEWESAFQVKAVQKLVTFYEDIQGN